MKNSKKRSESSAVKGESHRTWIGIVAVIVLLIGVVSVVSMQSNRDSNKQIDPKPQGTEKVTPVTKKPSKNYVTTDEKGEIVLIDRDNGKVRPLTKDEAKRLAAGINQMVNNSDEGLVQVKHDDGSVSMDLEGRFQNVMLAKVEADGSVSQSCVDNLEAAASFFEIDPALLGLKSRPVTKSTEKWPVQ